MQSNIHCVLGRLLDFYNCTKLIFCHLCFPLTTYQEVLLTPSVEHHHIAYTFYKSVLITVQQSLPLLLVDTFCLVATEPLKFSPLIIFS